MPSGAPPRVSASMSQAPRRVSLEIDHDVTPMHGRVAELAGRTCEFDGWLGMLTVLGQLLDAPSLPAGQSPPPLSPRER